VSSTRWNEQNVVTAATAKELVQALKGERQELRLEAGIRLEPALQALKNGFSLIEIIQHALECIERYLITQILVCTNGNKAETARILKIDYKTLYRKMYKYFGTFSDFIPAAEAGINGCSPSVAPSSESTDD
jgi:DNA-binding NtrC family response regulator